MKYLKFLFKCMDTNIVNFREKNNYKVKIAETFGRKKFDTLTKAKIAALNGYEYLKEKGDW